MNKLPRFGFKFGFWFTWFPTQKLGISFVYNRYVNGRCWVVGNGHTVRHYAGFYDQPVRQIGSPAIHI